MLGLLGAPKNEKEPGIIPALPMQIGVASNESTIILSPVNTSHNTGGCRAGGYMVDHPGRSPTMYAFYNSGAWKTCREAYKKKVGGLCEECLKNGQITPAEEIHHRIPLTPDNVGDPSISLNFDNLVALCREHHRAAHSKHNGEPKRYIVDDLGRVKIIK